MKKIERTISKAFKHCWLYRDELDVIIRLLTVNGAAPTIQSGDNELDNAEELYEFLGKKGKRSIRISSVEPSVTLRTFPFSGAVDVATYDHSDKARALHSRVVEAVEVGERKPHWRGRFWTYIAGVLLTLMGASKAYTLHDNGRYVAGVACGVGIALFIATSTYRQVEGVRFVGVARADRQTFLQRKGDDLAVAIIAGIIGAVLGGALGVAGTLLVQHIGKS